MTRRANPYRRTRSAGALMAAAGGWLAALALGAALVPQAAEAASGSGTSGLSGAAGTTTSASAGTTLATTTTASGGAAMSGPVTTTTPTSTSTSTTATSTTPSASGGGGLNGTLPVPSTGATSSGATSSGATATGDQTLSASGDGFTLQVHASGLTAHKLTITGTAPSTDAGQELVLQRAATGNTSATWVNAAHATIATGGTFRIGWTSNQSGHFQIRTVLASAAVEPPAASTPTAVATTTTGQAAAATSSAGSPALNVTIFKAADATFYGPGLWGRHTACGEVLRRTTLGVANRTLKCGTEINVYFNGNEITVPVIDRGPYVTGVNWDLTKATANAVGLTDEIGRGTIGTLVVDTLTPGTL